MTGTDPKAAVIAVLEEHFDRSNTELGEDPEIVAASWDRDSDLPGIFVPSSTSTVVGGSQTGVTATDGRTGNAMQRNSEDVIVNVVAGTEGDCEGLAADGTDMNPETVRWQLRDEAKSTLLSYGHDDAKSIAPVGGQDFLDDGEDASTDEAEPLLWYQFRARVVHDRRP